MTPQYRAPRLPFSRVSNPRNRLESGSNRKRTYSLNQLVLLTAHTSRVHYSPHASGYSTGESRDTTCMQNCHRWRLQHAPTYARNCFNRSQTVIPTAPERLRRRAIYLTTAGAAGAPEAPYSDSTTIRDLSARRVQAQAPLTQADSTVWPALPLQSTGNGVHFSATAPEQQKLVHEFTPSEWNEWCIACNGFYGLAVEQTSTPTSKLGMSGVCGLQRSVRLGGRDRDALGKHDVAEVDVLLRVALGAGGLDDVGVLEDYEVLEDCMRAALGKLLTAAACSERAYCQPCRKANRSEFPAQLKLHLWCWGTRASDEAAPSARPRLAGSTPHAALCWRCAARQT